MPPSKSRVAEDRLPVARRAPSVGNKGATVISSQHQSRTTPVHRAARGFTLVELLVVITIIGILTTLLLPAVNAARESGRETQCKNNLRQLAMGFQSHATSFGYYPSGGWGWGWFGDPTRGSGVDQPGGWVYNVLPYIDQQPLHDLQLGKSQQQIGPAAAAMLTTPLSVIICPSRRPVQLYPTWINSANMYCNASLNSSTGAVPPNVAKTDYAANAGDNAVWNSGPLAGAACSPTWTGSERDYNGGAGPGTYAGGTSSIALGLFKTCAQCSTGVVYTGSTCSVDSVTDGISNTYLLGEKYLPPDDYMNGQDGGDNENAYMGWNEDIGRYGGPNVGYPKQDTPGLFDAGNYNFGSPHPDGFGMAFCDGSVHTISYAIDLTVHGNLANRHDGNVIDQSKF
jgi:prepilin-type N-terminal cleavage/methylation domain-containing protein/prepilin-type processing-associated H-X9-DG protein